MFDQAGVRGKRDYALVAVLLGCGVRTAEVAEFAVEAIQQREGHCVIADMTGKGGHVRVPVPAWVKAAILKWMTAAGVTTGSIFRPINQAQRVGKNGFSPKLIWGVVRAVVRNAVSRMLLRTTFAAMPTPGLCRSI